MRFPLHIIICCTVLLGLVSVSRRDPALNVYNEYFAQSKNGRIEITHQGKIICSTVTLANGTQVSPDAIITEKDGSQKKLKAGECVDTEGEVVAIKQIIN